MECSLPSQSTFSRHFVLFCSTYSFSLDAYAPKTRSLSGKTTTTAPKPFRKICARLSSGVRYGIGFTLERSCGPECTFCTGTAFDRKCRYFSFRPHYEVKLELKNEPPSLKVCVNFAHQCYTDQITVYCRVKVIHIMCFVPTLFTCPCHWHLQQKQKIKQVPFSQAIFT